MRLHHSVVCWKRLAVPTGLGALLVGLALSTGAWATPDLYVQAGLTPVRVPLESLEFALSTPDGAVISSQALRGRVVLANFWAPWCEPCKEEMPALERLHAALAGEPFVLVAITADNREAAITSFAKSLGLTFPILLDEQKDVSDGLMVRGLPTTVLIGADGRVLARAVGPRKWDSPEMLALIRSLTEP